jgi:hypothetical protein
MKTTNILIRITFCFLLELKIRYSFIGNISFSLTYVGFMWNLSFPRIISNKYVIEDTISQLYTPL